MYFETSRRIRARARTWWYHRKLRDQGDIAEARSREHQASRHAIKCLREAMANGGFLSIGRGGATLHMSAHARLEFQGNPYDYCLSAGILTIDTRTIPDDRIIEVACRWPMPVTDATPGTKRFEEAGPFDYVRISDMLPHYHAAGATILNG